MLGSGCNSASTATASAERGILELAAEDLFNLMAECEERDFLLRVSFVEIYNETIRDLLSDASLGDATVAIREDPRKGVYCEAMEVIITDYESIIRTLRKGEVKVNVNLMEGIIQPS